MKLSAIFEEKPKQWGFRGDPYFWAYLKERAETMEMLSPDELEAWIKETYYSLSGKPLTDEYMDFAVIDQFARGGMSSGGVDNVWWTEKGIPLLQSRLLTLRHGLREEAGTTSADKDPFPELSVELQDEEWPFEYTDHDRLIVRAVCFDDDGFFYFVRADRDDDFGKAILIETAGGGVEKGEDLHTAIRRELREELGAEVEIVCKIGLVSDYYNLIHRHNLNHYFLCRIKSFGARYLTHDEIDAYHLSVLKLRYDEAVSEYEARRVSKLGRLIANRELPVLKSARDILETLN